MFILKSLKIRETVITWLQRFIFSVTNSVLNYNQQQQTFMKNDHMATPGPEPYQLLPLEDGLPDMLYRNACIQRWTQLGLWCTWFMCKV